MQIQELNLERINLKDLKTLQAYIYRDFTDNIQKTNDIKMMNTKTLRKTIIDMFKYGTLLERELNELRIFTYLLLKKMIGMNTEIEDYQQCINELDKQLGGME